jgi:purine-binding chemotaxis protein CheW
MAEQVSNEADQRVGRYLTFRLAEEEYGLEILKVREIVSLQTITAVPGTPDYVKGVINLRGKVIPTIDLRLKFGMPEQEDSRTTAIVITQVEGMEVGVVVDAVSEVLDVAVENVEDTPSFGSGIDTSFMLGIAKTEGNVTLLLDLEKLLDKAAFSTVAA